MVEGSTGHIGIIVVCFFVAWNLQFTTSCVASEKETHACQQEMARIRSADESLAPGPTNDLAKYETFVDEIQQKWKGRDKECFARLMDVACGPLSSGRFNSRRQYEVARRYALSALDNRDAIPLQLEIQLAAHVITPILGPPAPTAEAFAERRRKDVEVRLHALKRLMDAINPRWNPNEVPRSPNAVATDFGFPGTIAPESIKDATLRAKYEAAIAENRRKIERYTEQHKLRPWLDTFPKNAERYIIQAYSHPPCNVEELRKSLDEYKVDESIKARILNAVTTNCDKEKKE